MKKLRAIHAISTLLTMVGWQIWIVFRTDPQYKPSDSEPLFYFLLYGTIASQALLVAIFIVLEGIIADKKRLAKRKISEIKESMDQLKDEPNYKRPNEKNNGPDNR